MVDQPPPSPFGPPPTSPPVQAAPGRYSDPFAGMGAPVDAPTPRGRREGLWIALAALLGAAVAVGAIVWFLTRGGDEVATDDPAPTTVTTTEAPSDDTDEPSTEGSAPDDPAAEQLPEDGSEVPVDATTIGCPGGALPEICDAAQFIEEFRGRPFKKFPVVEFADEAEFLERLFDEFDDEFIADTDLEGEVLGSLGLVPAGTNLVEVTTKSLEIGVVGFYDPISKELVVRGSELDLFVELVIVHELVHAHDDQWFDLDRPEIEDSDDERFVGFLAVVEGNASRVEDAWRAELSSDEQSELAVMEATFYGPDDIAVLQQIPRFVLESQFFPYVDGPVLVEAIAADAGGGDSGERAVDQAILEPPATSEQALHPEQFLDLLDTPTVAAPRSPGNLLDEGVVGELTFDLWFGDRVGDGWNGDRYISFERDGRVCTVINVAADTSDDLDEFFDAAADWVGDAENGDSRRSDQLVVDGVDVVVIEGCR